METGDRSKWKRLADHLRQQIQAGQYQYGDRLPSEARLQQEHGVSLTTVRLAIARLRSEGLVENRAPKGTFVVGSSPAELEELGASDWVTAPAALTVTRADGSRATYPAGTRFGPRRPEPLRNGPSEPPAVPA